MNTLHQDQGYIDVKWGGRVMSVRTQDIRKSVMFIGLTNTGDRPINIIRRYLKTLTQGMVTFAWIHTSDGWRLSRAASEQPEVFKAIILDASLTMHLVRYIGARAGRCHNTLSPLNSIEQSLITWWPTDNPMFYETQLIHSSPSTSSQSSI